MHANKALIDRALNIPSGNDTLTMYHRLITLIDQYNTLAEDKGLPIKNIPSYNNHMNYSLMSRLMVSILKDIDRVKNIKEEQNDNLPTEEKTARGVVFTAGIITELPTYAAWKDGLWYYIQDGDDICVYGDTNAVVTKMNGGTELVLDYADMPYEVLIDKNENKLKVNKYYINTTGTDDGLCGLFGAGFQRDDWNDNVSNKLTSITLRNWTNRNVTGMVCMFDACPYLTTINLSDFNTSEVTNMFRMFYYCIALDTLDLSSFDTSKVVTMSAMFRDCTALQSLDLGNKFNTSKVENMQSMFANCKALNSIALYKSAESIISWLPSDTWTVDDDNNPPDLGTVTVTQGTSVTWNPTKLPDSWGDAQWTLSRTVQGQ